MAPKIKFATQAQKNSKHIPNKLYTEWGEKLDKNAILTEYPRPQLQRDSYINLNGVWDYAILNKNEQLTEYQGKILVPFAPESILSGVYKTVMPEDILYYRRKFDLQENFIKDKVFINFGAVDYKCKVFINGTFVGGHTGGYLPFSLDISNQVKIGKNEITLEVTDPSDTGTQARGKQKIGGGNIWYTPSSGIWQTVWLESVPASYINGIKITPNIEDNNVVVEVDVAGEPIKAEISILKEGKVIATETVDKIAVIDIAKPILWTPENPFLYDIVIKLGEDTIKSYFGMRKFSIGVDKDNVSRLMLNNKPYFHNGVLDQGYWSDGLYTAPSDEALIFDIQKMKDMGFNMLRKHIKIEPLRWYYHCDRLGMLVWQDFISGGGTYSIMTIAIKPFLGLLTTRKRPGNLKDTAKNYKKFSRECTKGRDEFIREMYATMDLLYNSTSLAVWVPFNEGWGQFDSLEVAKSVRAHDPTRIIDHASGWHDQGGPDLNSFHIYFTKYAFPKYKGMKKDTRPLALTEFGGFGYVSKEHTYNNDKIFGYRVYKTKQKLDEKYKKLYETKVIDNIDKGLAAAVYTQLSDVEEEVNGFYTYDRKELKISEGVISELNAIINKHNADNN